MVVEPEMVPEPVVQLAVNLTSTVTAPVPSLSAVVDSAPL